MATRLFHPNQGLGGSGIIPPGLAQGQSLVPILTSQSTYQGFVQVSTGAGGLTTIPIRYAYVPIEPITISGTITMSLWGYESAAQANATLGVYVYRYRPSTGVVTTIATLIGTAELGTSTTPTVPLTATATPTSTAFIAGDVLGVQIAARNFGTMGSGRTVFYAYGNPTSGAIGNSYVQFTENFKLDARTRLTG